MNRRILFPLFFLSIGLFQSIKGGTHPISISISLGKDTLALAEPTMLTVEITNNTNKELWLDCGYMFKLDDEPYPFSLFLVLPNDTHWTYIGSRLNVFMNVLSTPKYILLPPNKSVSKNMLLWWTAFVPVEYRTRLERIPEGSYKIFAKYLLPKYNQLEEMAVYSDTTDFVFLPLDPNDAKQHIALMEMDSLWDFFIMGGAVAGRAGLEKLRDSNTPYSEAAYTRLLTWIKDYDSFAEEKSRFNKLYPNSQFEFHLLPKQYLWARKLGLKHETDSLFKLISNKLSNHADILMIKGDLKIVQPPTMRNQ